MSRLVRLGWTHSEEHPRSESKVEVPDRNPITIRENRADDIGRGKVGRWRAFQRIGATGQNAGERDFQQPVFGLVDGELRRENLPFRARNHIPLCAVGATFVIPDGKSGLPPLFPEKFWHSQNETSVNVKKPVGFSRQVGIFASAVSRIENKTGIARQSRGVTVNHPPDSLSNRRYTSVSRSPIRREVKRFCRNNRFAVHFRKNEHW